jgi:hypothetical protein
VRDQQVAGGVIQTGIFFSGLYRASMTIKTLYYPTDAQIYNS